MDAARRDAGTRDSGPRDGGVRDSGTSDSGTSDSGASDSGIWDSGLRDSSVPWDGGSDAGVPCSVGGTSGLCRPVSECPVGSMSTPGLCPGPADIQCCTVSVGGSCDPSVMPTPNDGLGEAAGVGGCAPGMTRIDSFCIDVYEASLALPTGGTWSPFHNPGATAVVAMSVASAVPQGYISGLQAADACAAAGKRLCTDAEWLRACRGPGLARTYPYPGPREDGRCNDARAVHPAYERFGTTEDWVFSMLGDACINQLPDSLAQTGAYDRCVTDEGIYDLMGNLHEWTADPDGTFRGGYYVDTVRNGPGCLYRTTAHTSGHWDYSTGFRCCTG